MVLFTMPIQKDVRPAERMAIKDVLVFMNCSYQMNQ